MNAHETDLPARPPGENARLWEAEVRRRTNRAKALIREMERLLSDARQAVDSHGSRGTLSYYPMAWRAARLDATMAELELLDDLRKDGLAALPDPASLELCDPHCRGAADHPASQEPSPEGEPGFSQADTGTDTCVYCGRAVRYVRTGDPLIQVRVQHVHELPGDVSPHPAVRAHAPECAVCGRQVRYIPIRETDTQRRLLQPGPPREKLVHIGGAWPHPHEPVLALLDGVPYTVSCPECKRPVGVRCITLDTHEPTELSHKARWADAAAKERAERKPQERDLELGLVEREDA